MKSYTKESEQFVPVCKDYFTDYCIDHCNWFGTCWDFQEEQTMEKIYRVKLNSKGMPNFNTAVEIEDRPQGEWIEQEDDYHHYWECSECGMGVGLDDIRNYCPNCGCRMKGAGDE